MKRKLINQLIVLILLSGTACKKANTPGGSASALSEESSKSRLLTEEPQSANNSGVENAPSEKGPTSKDVKIPSPSLKNGGNLPEEVKALMDMHVLLRSLIKDADEELKEFLGDLVSEHNLDKPNPAIMMQFMKLSSEERREMLEEIVAALNEVKAATSTVDKIAILEDIEDLLILAPIPLAALLKIKALPQGAGPNDPPTDRCVPANIKIPELPAGIKVPEGFKLPELTHCKS